jgi:ParB family chromosome partitioning protein
MQRAPVKKEGKQPEPISFQVQKIQDDLASKFSTRVKLKIGGQGRGTIEIPFLSESDLSRILEIMDW